MKKSILWFLLPAFIVVAGSIFYGCTEKEEDLKGSIYGTVTDLQTNEPIGGVNVKLTPTGEATLTGSDGSFEFKDLDANNYTLSFSKAEYADLEDDYIIELEAGKRMKRDVQMEKLPSALRIINSDGQDISVLDFGAEEDVTSRTFSIFNESPNKLRWWIEENCNWIIEVKSMLTGNQAGEIENGNQEPIKVTIDRSLLGDGQKTYILNINSDKGSKELTIMAGENHGLPSLITDPVSNLTQSSVTFNGTIVDGGTPSYTERGFVYSTSAQPTIENNTGKITAAVTSQASFSSNVSGLVSNQAYYVRAYARNTVGVGYGNDIYFATGSLQTSVSTSAATNVSAVAATLNGTITVEGNPAYTEKGFCYNTTGNPTISNNKVVVTGSGIGDFSTGINNLQYNTTYHVKAYAIQNGQPIYGNEVTFSTSWTSTQIQTSAATSVSATSATFNGVIINEGSPAYTEKGFCYSTSNNPTITSTKIIVSGTGSGNFSRNVTNLDYQTTYYFRAYAIQDGQPVYGDVVSFTTIWVEANVQTSAATNITTSSARLNGTVYSAGTPAITEKGFCYSTSSNPTINNNRIPLLSGTGNFNYNLTGLSDGTTYYYRAYALQGGNPVYGNVVSFTTNTAEVPPVVSTNDVSNLTPVSSAGIILSWSVTFNGYISSAGSPTYVERGFVYSTYSNPTSGSGTKVVVSGTGTGSYSKNVSGLQNYNTYHVRAYAKTASGTYVYGEDVSFNTYDF